MKMRISHAIPLIFLMLTLIVGCQTMIPEAIPSPVPTEMQSPTATLTLEPTATYTLTPTATMVPTLTPTPTPIPVSQIEETDPNTGWTYNGIEFEVDGRSYTVVTTIDPSILRITDVDVRRFKILLDEMQITPPGTDPVRIQILDYEKVPPGTIDLEGEIVSASYLLVSGSVRDSEPYRIYTSASFFDRSFSNGVAEQDPYWATSAYSQFDSLVFMALFIGNGGSLFVRPDLLLDRITGYEEEDEEGYLVWYEVFALELGDEYRFISSPNLDDSTAYTLYENELASDWFLIDGEADIEQRTFDPAHNSSSITMHLNDSSRMERASIKTTSPLHVSDYDWLEFSLSIGANYMYLIYVALEDQYGMWLTEIPVGVDTPFFLDGSRLFTYRWHTVRIPLEQLGVDENTRVGALHFLAAHMPEPLYIDDIRFVAEAEE